MLLLIDNYDSFTYNLRDYFEQLGEEVIVVKNDEADALSVFSYTFNKVVISPGPNTPQESGNLMSLVEALHNRYPVLGVCLGHQALGEFFGAKLQLAQVPMHGKVSAITHDGAGIYEGMPALLDVCRYHSLVLTGFDGTPLVPTSHTAAGECMSFKHQSLPITGIQYHPEAILTECGKAILGNWLRLVSPAVSPA